MEKFSNDLADTVNNNFSKLKNEQNEMELRIK
jgi:hypothetical protein